MATGSGINVGEASGSKAATVEWFASDLSPINPTAVTDKPTVFKITVSISASAIIEWSWDSGSNWSALNSGTALGADQTFCFKVSVRNGDLFNMRTPSGAATVTVDLCRIDEYPEES